MNIANFVSIEQCQSWLSPVFKTKLEWHNYFDFINSFGRAWYLDIEAGNLNLYYGQAMHTNRLLHTLDGLVETLVGASRYLLAPDGSSDLPCRARHQNLGPYWAEAGVVVMTEGRSGQVHADYEGLAPYPASLFDEKTRAYSAIISLAKPDQGGHLKVWAKRRLGNEEMELEDYTVEILDYAIGSLALFDSFCYHQILPSQMTEEKPYRAIAAVHFLYRDEPHPHWEYWF